MVRDPGSGKTYPGCGCRGQKNTGSPDTQHCSAHCRAKTFLRFLKIVFIILNGLFAFFPDMIQTNHIGEWRPVSWSRPITAASWLASAGILSDHNASAMVTWHTSPPSHIGAWRGGCWILTNHNAADKLWHYFDQSRRAFRMLQANQSTVVWCLQYLPLPLANL